MLRNRQRRCLIIRRLTYGNTLVKEGRNLESFRPSSFKENAYAPIIACALAVISAALAASWPFTTK
jgi:hypothetical protein